MMTLKGYVVGGLQLVNVPQNLHPITGAQKARIDVIIVVGDGCKLPFLN